MVTTTTASDVLRSYYLNAVAEQLNKTANPLLAAIEQTTTDVTGKDVRKAVVYGMHGGVGARSESGDLPESDTDRYAQLVSSLKNLYGKIEISDKAIRASDIEGKVTDTTEAVCWVSNESSTGVLNPSTELAEEVRRQNPDALVMVDAVTSAFAADLDLRRMRPDALMFGTQKALALPPGLAFVCVSEEMMERSAKMKGKGFYTDFVKLKKNADENYALTTPPVSLMYALDFQLDRILAEGMKARYERHSEMARMVEEWAQKRFDGLFPEEGFRSKTIGVVKRGGLDFDAFHTALKANGYEISNGYGDIKSSTFRIGHMGDITPAALEGLIKAMDETLEEMQ